MVRLGGVINMVTLVYSGGGFRTTMQSDRRNSEKQMESSREKRSGSRLGKQDQDEQIKGNER